MIRIYPDQNDFTESKDVKEISEYRFDQLLRIVKIVAKTSQNSPDIVTETEENKTVIIFKEKNKNVIQLEVSNHEDRKKYFYREAA